MKSRQRDPRRQHRFAQSDEEKTAPTKDARGTSGETIRMSFDASRLPKEVREQYPNTAAVRPHRPESPDPAPDQSQAGPKTHPVR